MSQSPADKVAELVGLLEGLCQGVAELCQRQINFENQVAKGMDDIEQQLNGILGLVRMLEANDDKEVDRLDRNLPN